MPTTKTKYSFKQLNKKQNQNSKVAPTLSPYFFECFDYSNFSNTKVERVQAEFKRQEELKKQKELEIEKLQKEVEK